MSHDHVHEHHQHHVHDHHDHGHHHHGHGHHHHGLGHNHAAEARQLATNPANRTALYWSLAIALTFMVVEIGGGLVTNSVALLSDAVHMAADSSAYLIAVIAARMAMRPATAMRTYGWARAEILAALINGGLLVALSIGLAVEATRRLAHPQHVHGGGVTIVACIGLLANIAVIMVLMRADRSNFNIRGAMLHGITDALSSVYVIAAGALVALTGIDRIDSGATYLIAILTMWGAWRLVRDSIDVLLDVAPRGIDADTVGSAMLDVPGVTHVHDLHIWQISPDQPALSAHVRVRSDQERDSALHALQTMLTRRFMIDHTTIQITVEHASAELDAVERMSVPDAIDWATTHLSRTYPSLSKSVITAAAGAAALGFNTEDLISPVALSVQARKHLGTSDSEFDHDQ